MKMNKNSLYEQFLNINLKYRYLIFDFIDNNCPIAPKKKSQVLYEKIKDSKPKDQDDIKKRRAKILKNIKLYDYGKIIIFHDCERCSLCNYETILEFKKQLKDLLIDILGKSFRKEKKLNDFIENFEDINFKIERDGRGNFSFQKGDTLKQMIYYSFIENISELLNANFGKQNKYFIQIAKLFLVNNDFLKDLNNIKERYFYPRTYETYTLYQPRKEYKENFSQFQNEFLKLREKYKLSPRWGRYIIQGMLTCDIDKNGELVVPKDRPIPMPPTGDPGWKEIIEDGKRIPDELIVEGDEPENIVRDFTKIHNIKSEYYHRTKNHKQPLRDFDRNFRWYKKYQKRLKDIGTETKDSIFSEIFLDDIKKYPKDWQEPDYTENQKKKNELVQSTKEDIEIKGIKRIRAVLYRLDNIVYKKEK